MRLIDADRLLDEKRKTKYYHLPNGDIAIPIIDIEHAPTIEPKQGEWIPCSERMPEKDGRYYVTRQDYVTQTDFTDILWYEKGIWWNRQYTGDFAVIAWQPLPEPWKGADNE